jgi:hypothetical protein
MTRRDRRLSSLERALRSTTWALESVLLAARMGMMQGPALDRRLSRLTSAAARMAERLAALTEDDEERRGRRAYRRRE